MKKAIFAMMAGAALTLGSCSSASTKNENNQEAQPAKGEKTLVLYYSTTGATKAVAEELQRQLGADLAAIEAVEPYPEDYDSTIMRWRDEIQRGVKPEIKRLSVNLDDYSTIFLGFPVWGGTCALPVATFVAENPLKGKNVVTFATFGSGGITGATADIAKALPQASVKVGYGVRNARLSKMPEEVKRFLIEGGYIDGTIEALPDYSAQVAVTEADVEIFNRACSDYKFPLGTPVSVGKRANGNATDYKFIVNSKTPDGKEGEATIYVTAEGSEAEFTRVDR